MSEDNCDIPAPASTGIFIPEEIFLYGVKLNRKEDYADIYAGDGQELRVQLNRNKLVSRNNYSIVAAYGYAYEGYCYRFDRVRLLVVTVSKDEDPVGCGYDFEKASTPAAKAGGAPTSPAPKYRMWRIMADTKMLELATAFNDAKTLILDANLPGVRAPNSYSITVRMAHRGGRMTRD
ncbi:hypothetical protein G6N74_02615 [Mesorhizobium sp. CGMCC 1.15528]|uniref:Uncharacterized protein n=1 Tax=Mesorhizobium zhangyense TaxID=1776730 RepID=A0A7C9VAU3_9HYPH|nr:hypothetical protein [Mesorhizobium zhangyense]NGN39948.1 hypothetical protein [Mesorhizobium zhangyense]